MATAKDRKDADASVASQSDNEKLEHAAGGATTRDDANDLGVPMLPGDGSEPTGPEDALGIGPKRGDYSGRIGPENYQPHETVVTGDGQRIEAQRPRVGDRGDDKGRKGGTRLPQ